MQEDSWRASAWMLEGAIPSGHRALRGTCSRFRGEIVGVTLNNRVRGAMGDRKSVV